MRCVYFVIYFYYLIIVFNLFEIYLYSYYCY